MGNRVNPENPIQMNPVKADFRNFMYLVWKHLNLPDPTPVQYEIAYYLQHGPDRQIIEAFRGVGKSWITSAFVVWTLLRNPNAQFLVVSASKQRADAFSTFTLRLIYDMPILQHLIPRTDQRNSKIAFDVDGARAAHAPSVKSAGVFGQLAGSRSTHIIADDVEIPNNSATQDMRDKLLKAVMEFEAIKVPEGGRITYLGTPQTEESIYNKLRGKGFQCCIWPARVPTEDQLGVYQDSLAPSIERMTMEGKAGRATDPRRFTDVKLMETEASMGRSGFALQFMLDTAPSDADKYPLKLSDLIVMDLNPKKAPALVQYGSSVELQMKELANIGFDGDRWYRPLYSDKEWAEFEGSVMAIDPSGRGADETTYAVVKQLHGMLFLTAFGGFKGGYEDHTLYALAQVAKDQNVNEIVIESNFGDGMFSRLFQPVLNKLHRCVISEKSHHTQKEKRIIDVLEPVMNRHKLVIDRSCVVEDLKKVSDRLTFSLFYQMTRITRERGALKHDDLIDVLSMAVAYWVESMSRDDTEALKNWKEQALEDQLQEFVDGCTQGKGKLVGRPVNKNNWLFGMQRK